MDRLEEIEARRLRVLEWAEEPPVPWKAVHKQLTEEDVPWLVAEVKRLRKLCLECRESFDCGVRYQVDEG